PHPAGHHSARHLNSTKLFLPNAPSITVAGMDEGLGVRAGSSADFERLLRANAHSMLRFADFVLPDRSAAEDAVQDAVMLAWNRRQTLRVRYVFVSWLRT